MKHLLIPIVIVITAALVVSVFIARKPQDISPDAAAATILSLTPTTQSKSANQNVDLNIQIASNTNSIVGVELYIEYDRTQLQFLGFQDANLFPNSEVVSAATVTDGAQNKSTIAYTRIVTPGNSGWQGTGSMGTLQFKALKQSIANVSFAPSTLVVATNETGTSVLSQANGATINISPAATASSVATQTATATATATATQTATATATQTATATATSTSASTATATATACVLKSDINNDKTVNLQDFALLIEDLRNKNNRSDVNNDGKVSILDYIVLFEEFGNRCTI